MKLPFKIVLLWGLSFMLTSGSPYVYQLQNDNQQAIEDKNGNGEYLEEVTEKPRKMDYFSGTIQKASDSYKNDNPPIEYSKQPSKLEENVAINFDPNYYDIENNDHYGVFGLGPGVRPIGSEFDKDLIEQPDIFHTESVIDIIRNEEPVITTIPEHSPDYYYEPDINKNGATNGGFEDKIDLSSSGADVGKSDKYYGENPGDTFGDIFRSAWGSFKNFVADAHDTTEQVAKSLGSEVHSVIKSIKGKIPQVWQNFTDLVSSLGFTINKGAEFVLKRIVLTFQEAHASDIIVKLEKKLEVGDVIVDQFFQKVGEKMTTWIDQNGQKNVDKGFFDQWNTQEQGQEQGQGQEQHFIDPAYPDLFQDKEIQIEMEKMVKSGILNQQEMDLLTGIQTEDHYTRKKESAVQY